MIGVLVSGGKGWVLYNIGPMLLHPGAASGGTRFSGTREQGRLFLGILGAVELFGVTAMGYGLWQILTGRRSKWVIYFLVAVGLGLLLVARFWPDI